MDSILNDIKLACNVPPTEMSFDSVIIMYINSVFSTLTQLGIGPAEGFMIADESATWDAFIGTDPRLNSVKSYMTLRVRLLFDPPPTSFLLDATNKMIQEAEWRINVHREGESWTDPTLPSTTE